MKPFIPEISKLPARKVLTITTIGDPNKLGNVFPALYGTAHGTKFKVFKPKKIEMKIGTCSAFWPDVHLKPKAKWTGIWNLEIPAFVKQTDLIQKNPKLPVKIGKLPAGQYAQVLYVGKYAGETATIKKLHAFVKASGSVLAGSHEGVYLTKPGPKAKTIIRYRVQKKK